MTKYNHTVKDSLFSYLVSYKNNLREIYLSLHPEDKEIENDQLKSMTLENVFFDGIYNDLSFSVRGRRIIFLEVQSTWSDNVLLRFIRYYSELLPKMVDNYLTLQYSRGRIKDLPVPEFYLLYTKDEEVKRKEMKLSEIFFNETDSINLKVKVLTKDNAIGILKEYTHFCIILDRYLKEHEDKEVAIALAIEEGIKKGLLKDLLIERELEVKKMISNDILWELEFKHAYDDSYRRGEKEGIIKGKEQGLKEGKEEGLKEGEERGIIKGKEQGIIELVKDGLISLSVASKKLGLSEEEIKKKL